MLEPSTILKGVKPSYSVSELTRRQRGRKRKCRKGPLSSGEKFSTATKHTNVSDVQNNLFDNMEEEQLLSDGSNLKSGDNYLPDLEFDTSISRPNTDHVNNILDKNRQNTLKIFKKACCNQINPNIKVYYPMIQTVMEIYLQIKKSKPAYQNMVSIKVTTDLIKLDRF